MQIHTEERLCGDIGRSQPCTDQEKFPNEAKLAHAWILTFCPQDPRGAVTISKIKTTHNIFKSCFHRIVKCGRVVYLALLRKLFLGWLYSYCLRCWDRSRLRTEWKPISTDSTFNPLEQQNFESSLRNGCTTVTRSPIGWNQELLAVWRLKECSLKLAVTR